MQLNKRNVVDVEVDGIDHRDHPDYCDAYFSRAVFEDTGVELTGDELEALQEQYPGELNIMAYESQYQ